MINYIKRKSRYGSKKELYLDFFVIRVHNKGKEECFKGIYWKDMVQNKRKGRK